MFKACTNERRGIKGVPLILATSSNSSTETGSAIKAGTLIFFAILSEINPPNKEA